MSSEPMRVFLNTDIGPDCDDTAALAILLQLCREGRASLLGVTHCTGSPYGLAAIDAICRPFGASPTLGTCADKAFLASGSALCYTPAIAAAFPHGYPPGAPQPDALNALMQALSPVPAQSVTFIAIGPLRNVARFLTHPDAARLMHEKVARIVLMAGCLEAEPPLAEWNVEMDVPAARALLELWPGELRLCPFEAYADVLTGACLSDYPQNPVSVAYRLHTKGAMLRPSWDPGTVAAAVLGPKAPFEWSRAGTVTLDAAGITRFAPHAGGKHFYMRRAGCAQDAAAQLEALLRRAVETMAQSIAVV